MKVASSFKTLTNVEGLGKNGEGLIGELERVQSRAGTAIICCNLHCPASLHRTCESTTCMLASS
jgi:hypothetical protein